MPKFEPEKWTFALTSTLQEIIFIIRFRALTSAHPYWGWRNYYYYCYYYYWAIHLLGCNLQIPHEVPVAFKQEQMSSGGTQPSQSVSTLNHSSLQLVGRQQWPNHCPFCSWLPASLFMSSPYPAKSLFCLLPHPMSCLFLAPFVQVQTTMARLTWLGNLCNWSPQGTAMPAILCPCKGDWYLQGLSLMGFFASLHPWHCQLNQNVLVLCWPQCTTSGNSSFFRTLPLISQEVAVCIRLGFGLLVEKGLAPSLMKVMAFFDLILVGLLLHLSYLSVSVRDKRRFVMVPLYCRWVRDVLQADSMCANIPFWPQSLQFGSSLRPHVCKCNGEGGALYTDCKTQNIWKVSSLHISAHEIFNFSRSHFIHAPWEPFFTALAIRLSSLGSVLLLGTCLICSLNLHFPTAVSVQSGSLQLNAWVSEDAS